MDDKIKQYKETLSLEKQSPTQVGLLRKGERHLNLRRLPFAADGAIQMSFDAGTPGAIRTRGLSLRRRTLYPAELQARMFADKSLCIVPQNAACVNKFLA